MRRAAVASRRTGLEKTTVIDREQDVLLGGSRKPYIFARKVIEL